MAVAVALYGVALILPAHCEGSPALGDSRTFTGLECLLSPFYGGFIALVLYPSWLANPLFFLSLLCVYRRWDGLACGFGVIAILFALKFILESHDPSHLNIRPAFGFWTGAMFVVASTPIWSRSIYPFGDSPKR